MIKAVLFDFDGVLGDSYEIIIDIFQRTLKKFNFPVPDASVFAANFGFTRRKLIEFLLPKNHSADIDAMEKYVHELSLQKKKRIKLMPGAKNLLDVLKQKYTLAVISSRGGDSLTSILQNNNIESYFNVLIHRESVKDHKPHPEGILKALKLLNLQKNEVVFVGDAKEDVYAAKNAGVISIFFGKENIHNADYHIQSLSELLKILKQL